MTVGLASIGYASGVNPAVFYGDPNARFTAINTGGGITLSRTIGYIPAFVHASASAILATGTVVDASGATISAAAIRPYERLEFSWNFGDASGVEIFTDPRTKSTVNANDGQRGPEAVYCYRVASGTPYTITLTIRGISAGGLRYLIATVTAPFTASAFTTLGYTDYYFDSVNGLSGNSGADATHPKQNLSDVFTNGSITTGCRVFLANGSSWTNVANHSTLVNSTTSPVRILGYNPALGGFAPNNTKPVVILVNGSGQTLGAISNSGSGTNDFVVYGVEARVDPSSFAGGCAFSISHASTKLACIFKGSIAAGASNQLGIDLGQARGGNDYQIINGATIATASGSILPDAGVTCTSAPGGSATVWANGTIYAASALVFVQNGDGTIYSSVGAGNVGHNPSTDNGTNWTNTGKNNAVSYNISNAALNNADEWFAAAIPTAIGAPDQSQAMFRCTIAGTAMSITNLVGTINANHIMVTIAADGTLAPNTKIISGAGSTWTITPSQTVSSPITCLSSVNPPGLFDIYVDNCFLNDASGLGSAYSLYCGGTNVFVARSNYARGSLWNCVCTSLHTTGPVSVGGVVAFGMMQYQSFVGVAVHGSSSGPTILGHYFNCEQSQDNVLCRWSSTDAGGAITSNCNVAFHPRAQNMRDDVAGSINGNYVCNYGLVADSKFTYCTNGLDFANESNLNNTTLNGYYQNTVIERTDFGWISSGAVTPSGGTTYTTRDCHFWYCGLAFTPSSSTVAQNSSALQLSGCFYRNWIYRPQTVGNYGGGGQNNGAAINLFPSGVHCNQTQEVTDNIVWDDRSVPIIISCVAADLVGTSSLFDRNQFWAPNGTSAPLAAYMQNNSVSETLLTWNGHGGGGLAFDPHSIYLSAQPAWVNATTGQF